MAKGTVSTGHEADARCISVLGSLPRHFSVASISAKIGDVVDAPFGELR